MTNVIYTYLLFVSFEFIIISKLKIQERGNKSRFKIIFDLCKCDYCFRFWVAVLTTVILNCYIGFGWLDLLSPFATMGIWLLLNTVSDEK